MKVTFENFIGFSTGLLFSLLIGAMIRVHQMQDKIAVLEQHTELLKEYTISIDKELAMVKMSIPSIPMEKQ